MAIISGHKYYISFILNSTEYSRRVGYLSSPTQWFPDQQYETDKDVRLSIVVQAEADKTKLYIGPYGTSGSYTLKNVMCVDLSLLYGTEIDGLTDDEIIAKFESDYPNGYYQTNEGILVSNDASALETVGFNQWDEEWELGTYSTDNGAKTDTSTRIRSVNMISLISNADYYIRIGTAAVRVYFYDSEKNYIDSLSVSASGIIEMPTNCKYITLSPDSSYGVTYNHDICVNISDASKNGTYEPYKKSTLPLGLNSFRVKDSQGNIITITGGLKSAGDTYDEIVGNKYIKRIGEVDLGAGTWSLNSVQNLWQLYGSVTPRKKSTMINNGFICSRYKTTDAGVWLNVLEKEAAMNQTSIRIKDTSYSDAASFKASLSGAKLYYELETPIEYDLVEPIVPTVKAGTTEARVSPNVNGLSAPFRSDITYSASENNDAAYSQYAATAGRLLNAQTIWGRTFDGSSPVSGALTGVTNLTASGVLKGSRLVSTVAQGTAPLTVTSDTMVVNLNANYLGGVALGNLLTDFSSPAGDSPQSSITVGGRTEYARINADTLDGQHGSYYAPLQDLQTVAGRVTSLENWFLSPELAELTVTQLNVTNEINGNAKTATKLKTTRTIWGRNFDGSANVTGALSSVTNINSLIYLSNGYVGIGVSAPSHALDVSGNGHFTGNIILRSNADYGNYIYFGDANNAYIAEISDNDLTIHANSHIKLSGTDVQTDCSLYVGTSSNIKNLTLYGKVYWGTAYIEYNSTASALHANSGLYCDSYITAGASASSSDARLKDNITAVSEERALSILSSLRGAEWDWNDKKSALAGLHGSGLVAQEVQKVMPWAVLDVNGELALNYNSLWGVIIPVIQSMKARIEELESKLSYR